MAQTDNHLVIMAGGVGSRFWPMSTADRPKQFIDVLGVGKTLIQLTNERFSGVIPPCNVWVVTNEKYVSVVQEQLPDIPVDHILSEPCRRNTAPCIAYVSWRIKKENPKANIVVSPSDHIVTNPEEFRRVVTNCLKFTAETDAIVTLGMKPTRPETGYGYIQADLSTASARNKEIFRVDQFREKPDLATAIQYTKQSNFFWNAGIFIWSASTIVNAFRIYQPGVARIFENIMDILGTADEQRVIDEVYPECDNISVDYAIMEKAEEIFVCPADFGWSDLGTWGSLLAQTPHDLYGNAIIGENIQLFDSKNCIIHTTEERKVVVQGLDGYIVAEKDDTLLICKLSEEQRIKQFSGE
ncbi:MAG: mannose-1-phosphate guanylyltransferase [Prevotella histicola]|jgi:putative mannose-1-phosphate guanylyltransferase/mannose-6-phosphate isomerase|uniref:mannose-1-phosphate guanylyltransferase n=2 Tax=Prevotella histicola TaxID=470565 RepID=A0A930HZV2_9BACT|nr:mannose-1-phosphate guanylyltransferase [Prevotella histicola]KGF29085.1 mannose-1-phosphate guanylyltransferase [Prevotella histicola JCM 15637 = DNF00424]MBF1391732.1 mannose-1-phosphate guanylyltransferase [Prevotella histicola]MBF1395074.1 mannose-1-phosphate guanylyltransferase [Prevotella histicola]MBF1398114.1 mannose-1-phosphate guanylyltransferase [Prevotella histicola]MBF1399194.1 mannose-1-phosphate guanylyltransferase [Prevotella histicola]